MSWRTTYGDVLSASYLTEVAPAERHAAWTRRLAEPAANQLVLVAEQAGEIAGFACVFAGENARWGSYLDNLHVRSPLQSRGLGTRLLSGAARWCSQVSPTRGLCLLVNQANVSAQGFYKRLGARNAEESVWNAPDGSVVPTFWFVWDDVDALGRAAGDDFTTEPGRSSGTHSR
jgi:GNAT superfamily N-acetyltransferase